MEQNCVRTLEFSCMISVKPYSYCGEILEIILFYYLDEFCTILWFKSWEEFFSSWFCYIFLNTKSPTNFSVICLFEHFAQKKNKIPILTMRHSTSTGNKLGERWETTHVNYQNTLDFQQMTKLTKHLDAYTRNYFNGTTLFLLLSSK